jgi:hypothetical protein
MGSVLLVGSISSSSGDCFVPAQLSAYAWVALDNFEFN